MPHLDIYYMNNTIESSSNFIEMKAFEKRLFEPDTKFIDSINNDPNNTWKARNYTHFQTFTNRQMRFLLGSVGRSAEIFESFLQTSETNITESKVDLPLAFDWRSVEGVSYDSKVRKQGDCGSCYAISVASMVESRIRIKSKFKFSPLLSITNMISCSRYNQGCQGGFPYLLGKFGNEFGFVDETCQPYSETDAICNDSCDVRSIWKVKKYGYVGDFYGGASEQKMMEEIYRNGPIVLAINATPELYYYSEGIYSSNVRRFEPNGKGAGNWEFTNHAVVCVGWGEEEINGRKEKYWIIKNSWGEEWGLKGYFKIKRGENVASVEAQAIFMEPDI